MIQKGIDHQAHQAVAAMEAAAEMARKGQPSRAIMG
jgi:hypothetical protein